MTSVNEHSDFESLSAFRLYKNYPNPFNGGTRIPFYLPAASMAELRIADISGNVVFKQSVEQVGVNEIEWDGRTRSGEYLPSGVYFVTLQSGNYVETIKATLVR